MTINKMQKLEDKIMSQIKGGKIKLRSKYIFIAEKLGLSSGFVLSVLLAILFFNLAFYCAKESDNLAYLNFGSAGFLAFLESFPYLLIAAMVILAAVAGFFIKKSEGTYKWSFGYLAIGLIVMVMLGGGILAYTGVSERIEEAAFKNRMPSMMFRPFLERGIDMRHKGIAGRIAEIGETYLLIETPRGVEKVNYSFKNDEKFEVDGFIIAIGRREGDVFVADRIKMLAEDEMPMIRRGIHRMIGPSRPFSPPLPPLEMNRHDFLFMK